MWIQVLTGGSNAPVIVLIVGSEGKMEREGSLNATMAE